MMTREEIAAIDRECEKQHISQQEYMDSHGIAKHQYYRWKRKYREEDEQSLVPAGFVPLMPGTTPVHSVPAHTSKGKQQKHQDQESFLTVEIRTSCGSAMHIRGCVVESVYYAQHFSLLNSKTVLFFLLLWLDC